MTRYFKEGYVIRGEEHTIEMGTGTGAMLLHMREPSYYAYQDFIPLVFTLAILTFFTLFLALGQLEMKRRIKKWDKEDEN